MFIGLRILLLTITMFLVGCGGEESTTNVYIELSESRIETKLFSSPYTAKEVLHIVKLEIKFEGDGVIIGFAPEVSEPDWLQVSQADASQNSPFELTLTFLPEGFSPGNYSTELRFLTGRLDGSDQKYVDLPISLSIAAPPTISPASIQLESSGGATFATASNELSFNGYQNLTQFDVIQPDIANWVEGQATLETSTLTVQTTANLPTGGYRTDIKIAYTIDGYSGYHIMPVTYQHLGDQARVETVAPATLISNTSDQELAIYGSGFTQSDISTVWVGSTEITDFSISNDFLINVVIPPLDIIGEAQIQLGTPLGNIPAGSINLKTSAPLPGAVFDFGERIEHLIYSDTLNAVFVKTESALQRIEIVNGNWVIESTLAGDFKQFDLTPDHSELVFYTGDKLMYIRSDNFSHVAEFTLPYYSDSEESDMQLEKAANIQVSHVLIDGSVVLMVEHQRDSNIVAVKDIRNSGLLVFNPNSKTSTYLITDNSFALLHMTSTAKDKLLIVTDKCTQCLESFTGTFDPTLSTFSNAHLDWPPIINSLEFSGNGNLIFHSENYYDYNFNPILDLVIPSAAYNIQGISYNGMFLYSTLSGAIREYDIINKSERVISYPESDFDSQFPEVQLSQDHQTLFVTEYYSYDENRLMIFPAN